jgi:hypothetical protein
MRMRVKAYDCNIMASAFEVDQELFTDTDSGLCWLVSGPVAGNESSV